MGCTAGGKSKLAFELAQRLSGEILSVDSMKVYRRMDIGTAKPPPSHREKVRHHLIDVVDPDETFSLGRFLGLADDAISQVRGNGRTLIAAGGTGMYLRGLLEGMFEGPGADMEIRQKLTRQVGEEGLGALHAKLQELDPLAAERIHPHDEKRIVRALEVYELTGKPISSFHTQFRSGEYRYPWRLIEIARQKEDGNRRINDRVKKMVSEGLVAEVSDLLETGISPQAGQAVGYAEIINHLQGKCDLDDAIEQIKINTRRLAKSQRTWFRSFSGVYRVEVAEADTVKEVADHIIGELFL